MNLFKTARNDRFRYFLVSLLPLILALGQLHAQDFRVVHDGVENAEVTRTIDGQPVRMNLLRFDLSKVRLDVVHAGNGIIGTETTSSMARRSNAVAAINAGFFRLDTTPFAGDPAGIFQIDGKLLSESNNDRIALLIDNRAAVGKKGPQRTTVSIDHLSTYAEFWSGGNRCNISGIDRERKDNEAVLYTPEYGMTTPQNNVTGTEVVIQNKRVVQLLQSNGGTNIPRDGYVLSAAGTKKAELSSIAASGKEAIIILGAYSKGGTEAPTLTTGKIAFIETEDITGGVPQLIKNGNIEITWENEKTTKSFVETRHPRTAVAKLKDGKFLMITVDGRSESSGGISLLDLARYLRELGATDAMNLDGGGSTTMWLDGAVVNHPSDKEGERKVSDALIVRLRQPVRFGARNR
jgi:exopolysaccharide biosynthesis protein